MPAVNAWVAAQSLKPMSAEAWLIATALGIIFGVCLIAFIEWNVRPHPGRDAQRQQDADGE